ncbi:hypothetical protein PBC6_190 [Bacillus phage PBC6]|nr:hypothetical protein PBC6_190 [Bacillus phage PBC6]
MTIKKPLDLVKFVSSVTVLSDGTIPFNVLGDTTEFVSTLYKPVYSLSSVARLTLEDIKADKIELVNVELDPNTIVAQVMKSDLATYNPRIYALMVSVVLESFALLYSIEAASTNLQYIATKDFLRIKENINYIADYFGTEKKYRSMIETLRNMHISFGYLENQVDVIMSNNWTVR